MILANILKNSIVGTAKGAYAISRTVAKSLEVEIDKARMEDLESKEENFQKQIAHLTREERNEIDRIARRNAIVEMAKSSAKRKNEINRLNHKYSITNFLND